MADIEKYIPFVIYWETGVSDDRAGNETLFEKARRKGIANDPDDTGGATLVGITYSTFSSYAATRPTAVNNRPDMAKGLRSVNLYERFGQLRYAEWKEILKVLFWDRWHADDIRSQPVAEMLVDWVWTSGNYGITLPQKMLGVKADGIVGPETLAAVDGRNTDVLFRQLKAERLAYIDRICKSRPSNLKFRNGWIRRINATGIHD